MKTNLTRRICVSAVIAALYAALTLALPILSYGAVQLRFAEALTVLPFLLPEAIPGLAIGCFLSNLIGSPYALDWIVGTVATLLAALWTARLRNRWLAPMPPVICNAIIVGAEIAWFEAGVSAVFLPMWAYNAVTVGIGELLACYVLGILLLKLWDRVPSLRALAAPERAELLRIQNKG